MQNCAYCQKKIVTRFMVSITNLRYKDIEKVLHLSKSVVSRHMSGERNNPDIDIYVIEKVYGIKIKDYIIDEQ